MYTAPKSRSGGLVRYNPYSTRPPPVTSPLATHTHPQPGIVACGDSYVQPNNNTGCGREDQQAFVADINTNQFFPPCSYSNMWPSAARVWVLHACCSGCCFVKVVLYIVYGHYSMHLFSLQGPAKLWDALGLLHKFSSWPCIFGQNLDKFACIVILLMGKFCCCMLFYYTALRLPDGFQAFSQEMGLCLFVTIVLLLLLLVPGWLWCWCACEWVLRSRSLEISTSHWTFIILANVLCAIWSIHIYIFLLTIFS